MAFHPGLAQATLCMHDPELTNETVVSVEMITVVLYLQLHTELVMWPGHSYYV
jgi:hypothetical protein